VYLMPSLHEVPSQLHLLPRQAAREVEVGIDECDSQCQPWARGSLRLLRLVCHRISQLDGKSELMGPQNRSRPSARGLSGADSIFRARRVLTPGHPQDAKLELEDA
jgi:hypothetical protein